MDKSEQKRIELISVRSDNVRQRHTIENLKKIIERYEHENTGLKQQVQQLSLKLNELRARNLHSK